MCTHISPIEPLLKLKYKCIYFLKNDSKYIKKIHLPLSKPRTLYLKHFRCNEYLTEYWNVSKILLH
jgi:hypothetical protein